MLLRRGPLAVFIYAEGMDAQEHLGSNAVIDTDSRRGDHFVIIVGWDDRKTHQRGNGAWEIKNSWGEEWGDKGFGFVAYRVRTIGDHALWGTLGL